MAEDMDLRLRILARGSEALRVLRDVAHRIERIADVSGKVGRAGRAAFHALRTAASAALAPLRWATGILLGLGTAIAGLAAKSLVSAGNIETLRLRLEGVTDSARTANRIFAETMRLSVTSPFEPQELIDARIGLINIGMTGKDAIEAIGNAASIAQRPLGDLVSIMASMETEPLRRIGIEVKRAGDQYEFSFRDKMQRVQKITADGVQAARQALVSIFEVKYGGGMARFASAWKGLWSTLRGNIELGFAQAGEGLMPVAKRFVGAINENLATLLEEGTLKNIGERIGTRIREAWDYAAAVVDYAQGVFEALKGKDANVWADALSAAVQGAGQILAIAFVNYLSAMGEIFGGLGKIIGSGMIEALTGFLKEFVGPLIDLFAKAFPVQGALAKWGWNRAVTRADQAVANRGALLLSGIAQFQAAIPSKSEETAKAAAEIVSRTAGGIAGMAGYQGPSVDELYAERRRSSRLQGYVEVLMARPRWVPGRDNTEMGRWAWDRQRVQAKAGVFQEGAMANPEMGYGGYKVFHINKLEIRANNVRQMQNELVTAGGAPALAPAGT